MNINDVITLNNNQKFLIVSKKNHDNNNYYYMLGVRDDETDIINTLKVMKEVKSSDDNISLVNVSDEEILKINNLEVKNS